MKLLTIDEVAKLLKLNKHTIYRYAKDGKIPAVRIGGSWRIAEEVLSRWLVDGSSNNKR
ncbi:MAG: helix-turn-helix domain-containing protein [Candidatus Schekmanbacteria bacterium]|nr:helix-turn-helix domain-containing protein [Candidatus Schekmanbacteria bacterium]